MRDECAEWSDESFLDKMGLRVDGLLTYAAAILMGREEHSHLARRCNPYIRKSVRDERNVVRGSELFGTPFLLSVDRSPPHDRGLLREALFNAIGHQDYTRSGYITVTEHDYSKLVITNAGSFIPGDTRSAVESNRPPIRYRNGCLMNALYKMGFVEIVGGGIIRMCIAQAERGFPMPDYICDGTSVELTVHGRVPRARTRRS